MTTNEVTAAWADLATWWQKHKHRYNAPAIAKEAGLYRGRFYALMHPGRQGGSTARRTEQLYLSISDALGFRYYRPGQKSGSKPNPPQLREEYKRNGLQTLAEWYDVSPPTIRKWLVEYGIPLRAQGEKATTSSH